MNDIDKIAKDIGLEFNNVKFTKDQFKRGIDVEMTEHHDDPQTQVINSRLEAAKIAWAHLKEDPKYYTKLKKMEESTVLEELEELLNSLDEGVAKKYQSSAGGLNDRGRAYYNRQGHNLKKPVSSKQAAKSKKAAGRRNSFCGRMNGQKKMHNIDCRKDPYKDICKSLRRWDCNESFNNALNIILDNI